MIPLLPITELWRYSAFVQLEWSLLYQIAPYLTDGWKSVLYTNYAIVEKETAFSALMDAPMFDGLSRSWALYWAASRPPPGTVLPPGVFPPEPNRHLQRALSIAFGIFLCVCLCSCVRGVSVLPKPKEAPL